MNAPGETVQVSCNPGYELQGAAEVTCKIDGTWSSPLATCAVG